MRLINSNVFAADYSMRFPTVMRTRWDKPVSEVQTHEELCQVVQQRVETGELVIRCTCETGNCVIHRCAGATTSCRPQQCWQPT